MNPVKVLREARGLSREDLAAAAHVTYAYIYKLEMGKVKRPEHDALSRVAAVLGVPAAELLRPVEQPDLSRPPVEIWRALGWSADLIEDAAQYWLEYSEAERYDLLQRARALYQQQEALQADQEALRRRRSQAAL